MSERLWTGLVKRGTYWHLRYRLPGESKVRSKSLEVRERRVAETKQRQFEEDFERQKAGLPRKNQAGSLSEAGAIRPLLEEFLASRRDRGTNEKQLRDIQHHVQTPCRALGWTQLADINARSYETWLRSAEMAGKAPRTKNTYLKNFLAFLGHLVRIGLIDRNPLSGLQMAAEKGRQRRKRRALSDEELARLLTASPFERAIIYLTMVHAGLRRGDVERLQWRDVQLHENQPFLRLWDSQTKESRDGRVEVHSELCAALKIWRSRATDLNGRVFPCVPRVRELRKDLEAAGIPFVDELGRRIDLHGLRKTCNTRMAVNGVPIPVAQKQMRHLDYRLTADVYMDQHGLPVAERVAALPPILPSVAQIAAQTLGAGSHSEARTGKIESLGRLAEVPQDGGTGLGQSRADTSGQSEEKSSGCWIRTNDLVVNSHPLYR